MYRYFIFLNFYVWALQNDSTLPDGKHEQYQKLVVPMLIANVGNATMQLGGSLQGAVVMHFMGFFNYVEGKLIL